MRTNQNIEMIETVATGLGNLLDDVVFIGGAVTSLYIDDPAAVYIRPTNDVDCIIELSGRREFSELEENLRSRGFRNDMSEDAPICRWIYDSIIVDIMPTDEKILGFSNYWYTEGFKQLIIKKLSNNTEISLLKLPYFIATKIEAFYGRDESDFRISHDIEDIIIVLDGILSFEEFYTAQRKVKKYFVGEFKKFTKDEVFIESVSSHLERGQSPLRTKRVIDFINDFIQSEPIQCKNQEK